MVRNIPPCFLRCSIICSLLLTAAVAWAQPLPLIKLSDLTLSVGEDLGITASGLVPEEAYTLTLTSESNGGTVETVQADTQGDLSYTVELTTPGQWQLNVQGSGLDASFEVEVTAQKGPNSPAATPPALPPEDVTPAEPTPEEPATGEIDPFRPAQEAPPSPEDSSPSLERESEPQSTPAPTPEDAPQGDAETGAEDETASETTPAAPAVRPDEIVLEDGAVVASQNGELLWTLAFPAGSGETQGLLERSGAVYVGHGNSLLVLDPLTGAVQNRFALPSQVTDLSAAPDGLTATTETETVAVRGGELQAPLHFAAAPELFSFLRREAEVEDPAARLAQDPTNPWLYVRVGQSSDEPEQSREFFAEAVERAETFYDLAGLSRTFIELGEQDLAHEAFDKALQDFAERGYDPRLLRDLSLHEAYNFPLRPLQDALAAGDLERAGFWAPWLIYFATPDVPEMNRTLRDYAAMLRRNGQADEAARWRDPGRDRLRTPGTLASAALFLGRSAWYSALALLVATLALHLTLATKYWRAQSVNFERRRLLNRSVSPLSRLFIMRFYSLTEKLVLLVLLAGVLVFAGLASAYRGEGDAASLGSGTFQSAAAQAELAAAPLLGSRGDFVQGYAAQVRGDEALAGERYDAAGAYAPALNNLGVLSGDEAFYRRAIELSRLPEARYNLGESVDADGFAFQREYRPDDALLAVPSVQDVRVALSGDWGGAVADIFLNPWLGLREARPAGIDANLWTLFVVVFLILLAVTVVWLFIPRLRWVRNAPRTWLYHLLALLVPGSGLADEMWGLLLLIPWALVGLDVLDHLYGWAVGIGLSWWTDLIVLGVIYFVNTVAVAVEFWSYRRRMAAIKRENPELALEFGLTRPVRVRSPR